MRLSYTKKEGGKVSIKIKEVDVGKPVTIGRGKEAVIRVDDEKCSRLHSSILYWDGMFIIRDLKSFNGTLLNGEKIEVAKLNYGDVIKVGDIEITAAKDDPGQEDTVITQQKEDEAEKKEE